MALANSRSTDQLRHVITAKKWSECTDLNDTLPEFGGFEMVGAFIRNF
jgi:hypothetical protein